jgi:formylglycine-generating enzyme required for sulfatase activity
MPEPVTSYISSSWLGPLWKKLKAIRGEREQEIQRIKSEFDDPYDLARFYVEPNCQQHNPADREEDQEPRSAVTSPVFKTINGFLEGDYAVTRSGKNQMFILSDAGMGKTSLLVMLKLTYLTSFWPQHHHCELLKLGPDTLDRIKAIPAAGDTVLLLDALDEDRSAWGKIQERLLQILTESSHFRRVIVSCRTQFFPETSADPFGNPGRVEIGGFVCPMIFLSLFDDHQVEEYLEKRYPNTWFHWFQTNSKREQAQGFVAKMKDLRCRPMLLAHIEDLVASTLTDWNEYAVYQALVQAWLDREERRLRKEGHQAITAASLARASMLVASHLQRNGLRFLSEPKLEELIQAHPELAQLTQIKFGGRSLLNRNAQGDYRFSHFSVQEYLVAQSLLQESEAKEKLKVPSYASEKVIRFVLDGRTRLCPQKPLVLRDLNLARFDLSGVNLEGADLSGTDLSGAQLDGAKLNNVQLDGANLAGVCLPQLVEGFPFVQRINKEVSMEFVWIPPGSFLIGEPGEQVEVILSRGFWMGKHPVTQKQYESLAGENPSHFRESGAEAPVERVNWNEATAFCRKLQDHLGQAGNRHQCRLPTEAEWEYACRAGSQKSYCFGDDEAKLEEYAWCGKNSGGKTQPVGQKKPNQWGLHDMHGNVWEWCQDWYDKYPKGQVTDPTGPVKGNSRVLRGGSWSDDTPARLRSACRYYDAPDLRFIDVGFRCVWVEGSSPQAGNS